VSFEAPSKTYLEISSVNLPEISGVVAAKTVEVISDEESNLKKTFY